MTSSVLSYAEDCDHPAKRRLIRILEAILGRGRIEQVYDRWRDEAAGASEQPFGRLLQMYDIELDIAGRWPLETIPESPLVLVANHPFGVADGMLMAAIAERIGRPYKVLINARMMKVPEFQPYILPISFDETEAALEMNLATRNEAIRLLKDGWTIGIFPSGGVATAPRGFGPAEELPWRMFLPKMIQMGRASVLPLYIHGQNSLLFQAVSRFSLTVRIALLFREFRLQLANPIAITTGPLLPWAELAQLRDRKALLEKVQSSVMAMQPHDRRRLYPAAIRMRQKHWLWREEWVGRKTYASPSRGGGLPAARLLQLLLQALSAGRKSSLTSVPLSEKSP
jgi:putative hemolysin